MQREALHGLEIGSGCHRGERGLAVLEMRHRLRMDAVEVGTYPANPLRALGFRSCFTTGLDEGTTPAGPHARLGVRGEKQRVASVLAGVAPLAYASAAWLATPLGLRCGQRAVFPSALDNRVCEFQI